VLLWVMYRYDGPLNGLTDAQIAEAELWRKTRGVYEHGEWVGRDEPMQRLKMEWTDIYGSHTTGVV
jgi:hypothetical protein